MIDEALEEFMHQVGVELADQRARELDVVGQARPAREIDDHARQRLVERHVGMAEAPDAGFVADRLGEGLAERDADVLDGVVRVDVQVALGVHLQVEHAVARHLLEHVLEKRDAGGELGHALAVQVEPEVDLRLFRVALDFGRSHFNASRNAATSIRFSSGVPMVSRRQFSSNGWPPEKSFTSTPCCLRLSNTRAAEPGAPSMRASRKFAAEGKSLSPFRRVSSGATRSRSASTLAACASSTCLCCSSVIATASVSTLMLKGERVLLNSSIHSGRPQT